MLTEAQKRAERHWEALAEAIQRDGEQLKELVLKTHYHLCGSPFFSVLLRRPHVLSVEELSDILDSAIDQGSLSSVEALERFGELIW